MDTTKTPIGNLVDRTEAKAANFAEAEAGKFADAAAKASARFADEVLPARNYPNTFPEGDRAKALLALRGVDMNLYDTMAYTIATGHFRK